MKPDQKHQANLEILQNLEISDIRRRLNIENYSEHEYIPSEGY